jgi:hypothetical protein
MLKYHTLTIPVHHGMLKYHTLTIPVPHGMLKWVRAGFVYYKRSALDSQRK